MEVEINGELYLVDTITNRIFKSSFFKKHYDLEIVDSIRKKNFNRKQKELYAEQTKEHSALADIIAIYELNKQIQAPDLAEQNYELERSKEIYPEAWEEYRKIQEHMRLVFGKDKGKK